MSESVSRVPQKGIAKCPTGITGLDELTFGGLPKGRPTLVCGNAGCGKTLLAMQFLVNGIIQYQDAGVYMAFEETEEDLVTNFASLGIDLNQLTESKKLAIEHIFVERREIEETGEYDLDGLFLRLEAAIDSVGAKRVVLDTLEALFSGFENEMILRAELRRLFRWLKDKGVSAIITGERGERMITKFGLEEYVADCVIMLDHRVNDQISTRRLKIIKYRGSVHGTNEYPFLIDDKGISVLPITSLGLNYPTTSERVLTGIKSFDEMFDNKGYYRNSSILLSGTAGTGKTSMAGHFVNYACSKGLKCLYFAFEESPNQIKRNSQSIGLNLQQWEDKGLLHYLANRPTHFGLEMHLVSMHQVITDEAPDIVVIDSITNLISTGAIMDVKIMLTRLLDFLKLKQITSFLTDLSENGAVDSTEIGISSLCDTWIKLLNVQKNNELVRTVTIIKSRGMKHSNEVREFKITDQGLKF